jgi:hypothetical protein
LNLSSLERLYFAPYLSLLQSFVKKEKCDSPVFLLTMSFLERRTRQLTANLPIGISSLLDLDDTIININLQVGELCGISPQVKQ